MLNLSHLSRDELLRRAEATKVARARGLLTRPSIDTPRDPVVFAREQVGVVLDPWQEQVVRSQVLQLLLNCARQSGKSSAAALLALHTALVVLEALVLVLSPTLRQSQESFRRVTTYLARLPVPPTLVEDNKLSLQLAN